MTTIRYYPFNKTFVYVLEKKKNTRSFCPEENLDAGYKISPFALLLHGHTCSLFR